MKTKLITRRGYQQLQRELDHLWRTERPEVTKKVAWAASLGDRSENADYQYNKKRLREIDRRVRYLRKRLEDLQVVDYSPQQEGKVFLAPMSKWKMNKAKCYAFKLSVQMKFMIAKLSSQSMHQWRERC